jgi:hypothetical protein
MPFQMKDETAGVVLFYIDDAGQLGLGSLPVTHGQITVEGINVLSINGTFACGIAVTGVQYGYEGSVAVPPTSSATVSISTAQIPTATSTIAPDSVSNTAVVVSNPYGFTQTNNYSIW